MRPFMCLWLFPSQRRSKESDFSPQRLGEPSALIPPVLRGAHLSGTLALLLHSNHRLKARLKKSEIDKIFIHSGKFGCFIPLSKLVQVSNDSIFQSWRVYASGFDNHRCCIRILYALCMADYVERTQLILTNKCAP